MKRIPSLDGLRAISIVLVMLSHLVKWKHLRIAAIPAIACACLSYYLVEQPMLRLREKLARKAQPSTPALEPASQPA